MAGVPIGYGVACQGVKTGPCGVAVSPWRTGVVAVLAERCRQSTKAAMA